MADRDRAPRSAPVAEIRRPEEAVTRDWDAIVEEQARREPQIQPNATVDKAEIPDSPSKQTVFNDNNYIPRGADNVLSFAEPPRIADEPKPAEKIRVTIVEQTPSMKDQVCWPFREGSLERRHCKTSIGLNHRD